MNADALSRQNTRESLASGNSASDMIVPAVL